MKTKFILIAVFLFALVKENYCQNYPIFGNEIPVTINGLTFSVQDPFISPDGNTLIFNHDNTVPNIKLYYASKINDSTFNYVGEIAGANETTTNALDLSSSLDSAGNFIWTSMRNYNPPPQQENLMRGKYNSGSVTNLTKVYGNIYCLSLPYCVIMDANISYDGNYLYYTNTYFGPNGNDCGAPCYSQLSIAQKVNDTTFSKLSNSAALLTNVNDTNYLVYVPQITKDGLELYFCRVLRGGSGNTDICVSVRNTAIDTFSLPSVIYSNNGGWLPEAPSLTTNKGILYYHKESAYMGGTFKIYMRYRMGSTEITEINKSETIVIFPNPTSGKFVIASEAKQSHIEIYNTLGENIYSSKSNFIKPEIDLSEEPNGIYFLQIKTAKGIARKKIIIQR